MSEADLESERKTKLAAFDHFCRTAPKDEVMKACVSLAESKRDWAPISLESEWAELQEWERRLQVGKSRLAEHTSELVNQAQELSAYSLALADFLRRHGAELKRRDLSAPTLRLLGLISTGADRHKEVRNKRAYRTRDDFHRHLYPLMELGLVEARAEFVNNRKYARYKATDEGLQVLHQAEAV